MAEIPATSLPSISHFDDPSFRKVLEEAFSDILPDGRGWQPPRIDRKCWEVAMALLALEDQGALGEESEILGVGAGQEWTSYLLTRRCRRVFATDLYLTPGSWERTASTEMLSNPGAFFGGPWNSRRLVVQHMNALDLQFEDESFDGLFSSSSIEHVGDHAAIRRAAEEMCRVLAPGGVCSISTEYRLAGPRGMVIPETYALTPDELAEDIVDGLPWALEGSLALELDPQTRAVVVDHAQAEDDVRSGREQWSTYPQLVMRYGEHEWTSIHLTLRKLTK